MFKEYKIYVAYQTPEQTATVLKDVYISNRCFLKISKYTNELELNYTDSWRTDEIIRILIGHEIKPIYLSKEIKTVNIEKEVFIKEE